MNEGNLLDDSTPTITQTTVPINDDLWDMYAPPIPVKPPAPKVVDVRPFILSHPSVKYRK